MTALLKLPKLTKLTLAAALTAASLAAAAHDTWFHPLPASGRAGVTLALGTGNQFPVQESAVGFEHLVRSGCRDEAGAVAPLAYARYTPTALVVHPTTPKPVTCWAQLAPHEIELQADKIALYLKEIQAPAGVRESWAAMQTRGAAWKERYTKHARIELGGMPSGPTDMSMDVLLERFTPKAPIRPGEPLVFQVLRDGKPLADFAVELRGDVSRLGIWRKTDAQGRVQIAAPPPGRWVLRGTDLRLSTSEPDWWESRFVTLAFEVGDPKEMRVSRIP